MHDDELEQFKRDIHLVKFAVIRSGYRRLPRESSRSSHGLAHAGTKDKILVAREADGHWVYCSVRDDRDNGTIVDFVQHHRRVDLGRTRQGLRGWLHTSRPDPGPDGRPDCPAVVRDRHAVVDAFARARSLRNSAYLNSRGARILAKLAAPHARTIVQHSPEPGFAKDWNDVLQRFEREGPGPLVRPGRMPEHAR